MPPPLRSTFADDPTMAHLLQTYGTALGIHVQKLRTHLASNDTPGVRHELHQLKGSGRSFGFPAITEKAAAAETQLRDGASLAAVGGLLEELMGVMGSVADYRPA